MSGFGTRRRFAAVQRVQLARLLASVSLFQALGGSWSPAEKIASTAPAAKH
jgi:hypothetical protein